VDQTRQANVAERLRYSEAEHQKRVTSQPLRGCLKVSDQLTSNQLWPHLQEQYPGQSCHTMSNTTYWPSQNIY